MKSYFSSDENKRAKFIFDLIAPVYGLIDWSTKRNYPDIVKLLNESIPLEGRSALDVGTGTGTWIATMNTFGLSHAQGIDFSEKMIVKAKKNHPEIAFSSSDAGKLKAFQDNSFDIVTASFVMHGMKKEARTKVLKEMKRVAKHYVVIQDFYIKSSGFIRLIEWLERSDYMYFKEHFTEEMTTFFSETKVLPAHNGNGLYIGIK